MKLSVHLVYCELGLYWARSFLFLFLFLASQVHIAQKHNDLETASPSYSENIKVKAPARWLQALEMSWSILACMHTGAILRIQSRL